LRKWSIHASFNPLDLLINRYLLSDSSKLNALQKFFLKNETFLNLGALFFYTLVNIRIMSFSKILFQNTTNSLSHLQPGDKEPSHLLVDRQVIVQ